MADMFFAGIPMEGSGARPLDADLYGAEQQGVDAENISATGNLNIGNIVRYDEHAQRNWNGGIANDGRPESSALPEATANSMMPAYASHSAATSTAQAGSDMAEPGSNYAASGQGGSAAAAPDYSGNAVSTSNGSSQTTSTSTGTPQGQPVTNYSNSMQTGGGETNIYNTNNNYTNNVSNTTNNTQTYNQNNYYGGNSIIIDSYNANTSSNGVHGHGSILNVSNNTITNEIDIINTTINQNVTNHGGGLEINVGNILNNLTIGGNTPPDSHNSKCLPLCDITQLVENTLHQSSNLIGSIDHGLNDVATSVTSSILSSVTSLANNTINQSGSLLHDVIAFADHTVSTLPLTVSQLGTDIGGATNLGTVSASLDHLLGDQIPAVTGNTLNTGAQLIGDALSHSMLNINPTVALPPVNASITALADPSVDSHLGQTNLNPVVGAASTIVSDASHLLSNGDVPGTINTTVNHVQSDSIGITDNLTHAVSSDLSHAGNDLMQIGQAVNSAGNNTATTLDSLGQHVTTSASQTAAATSADVHDLISAVPPVVNGVPAELHSLSSIDIVPPTAPTVPVSASLISTVTDTASSLAHTATDLHEPLSLLSSVTHADSSVVPVDAGVLFNGSAGSNGAGAAIGTSTSHDTVIDHTVHHGIG